MSKVLVIGAGAQGGPCASILAGDADFEEIILGDIDLELAKRVAEKIGSPKVRPLKLDASSLEQVSAAAEGADVIINLTHLKFNDVILEAALKSGTHYVDTASSTEFLEEWIAADTPKLYPEFESIGKTALVGCGFAPGVANILTRHACDQLDRVESIVIRIGRKSASGTDEVVSEWKPTWSPEILLEDYSEEPMLLVDGKFVHVPIFSNPETYTFPEPIGDLLLSSHMHEEPYMIPKFYLEKGLQFMDFKYPVDKLAGAFIKMGFASEEPIDVNGVMVSPKDVLMKLVKRPGNKFFRENPETILQSDLTGIMDVTVIGKMEGQPRTITLSYRFTDHTNHALQRQLFDTFGTTMVYVALPAVVGAKLCLRRELPPGLISSDVIEPQKFFDGMAERGVPFEFDESIS